MARTTTLLPPSFNPLEAFKAFSNVPADVPDIIAFTMGDAYLNRPNLYPRQGTLLKIIFLSEHLFTDYDHAVIDEWEQEYLRTADDKGEGNNGIVPGVRERMRIISTCPCGHHISDHADRHGQCSGGLCQCGEYRGRRWFREVISVIGRRGSKGHVGGIAGAYILWNYICKGDPQGYYGVDRDKRLTCIVFAGKKEQAVANQWRDLNNYILGAPCFAPYISRPQAEKLTLYSRYDFIKMMERESRGVFTDQDQASFEIVPKESTTLAGRGPASFIQMYDEAAHVIKGVAKAPAEDVYDAASPSLDQFQNDAFIYIPSSPWQRIGLLHDKYQNAIERNEDGTPAYPEMLMVQLASWDLYRDWEIAHEIPRAPGELPYQRLKGAVQEYDDQMRQLERANPETFAVERRSRFAAVMDAYLNPDRIATIWEPYKGETLTQRSKGILSVTYRAHGDPSKSGAGFGMAMAHVDGYDERGLPHVVFDKIHGWDPADFEGHEVDYDVIQREIATEWMDPFMPGELTFDQFNSVATIQYLQRHARAQNYPKRVSIYERPATGPLNWRTYETFKTALGLGLIHGPYHELANLELTFLQDLGGKVDHPTSGPVQTKDIADCYHPSMEVLTEHGWMLIKDVPRGVKVATRSPEGRLEYQEPTDYIARHHKGVMYEYDSHRLSFSVTPTHRMLTTTQQGDRFVLAKDLIAQQYRVPKTALVEDREPNTISFDIDDLAAARKRVQGRGGSRTDSGWTKEQDEYLRQHYATASMADLCSVLGKTRDAIYNRAKPKHLNLKRGQIGDRIDDRPASLPETKVEDFAAFLGIWLAEGRKMRGKPGYDVKITQTKPESVEWIDQMFARLPWPVRRSVQANGETVWTVKSHGLREYLRACQGEGHELLIPDEVFATWTRREMEQLLEGLLVGDGCWDGKVGRHTGYYSTSKRLVDDVQRLLLHLGLTSGRVKVVQRASQYRANHDLWYVGVNTSQAATIYTSRLKEVEYDDMVYCLTVPNSTLLVRRNGVPMWSGNCMAIVTYELIGEQMLAFVGQMFSDVPLGANAQGGMDPYGPQRQVEEAHQSLSNFGRGRTYGAPGGRGARPGGYRRR